ncbi:MAG: zinc-finger domain-containing protein [Chromatiaceae bacterium]|nr:MAG: zinc-finger domain-containing protein [Chromatiaceae bacterium]
MRVIPSKPALDTSDIKPPPRSPEVVVVGRRDLPLSCPLPGHEVWNLHPRVYLPIEDTPTGEVTCPYCGARYRLER